MTNPLEPITPIDPRGCINQGLLKRECFAAMAMQAIISAQPPFTDTGMDNMLGDSFVAQQAILYADALIVELNKPTTT